MQREEKQDENEGPDVADLLEELPVRVLVVRELLELAVLEGADQFGDALELDVELLELLAVENRVEVDVLVDDVEVLVVALA